MSSTVLAGRYTLGERIGVGGMAEVYRAEDAVLQRTVAVKLMRAASASATDLARFASEGQTLAPLAHSGLVVLFDAGTTDDGHPFLVMELVDGPPLTELMARGPLREDQVGTIGAQVADALAYAHAAGVVHRDVKPGNVLLGRDRVKLADFGIAHLLGSTIRHTEAGTAIGTAAYLAPEQVAGEPLSGAVDVYALGLVLLEALTGRRPYPGSPSETALARLHHPPEIPADLPPGWGGLLAAMTARDPGHRPTAAEVAARLREPTAEPTPAAPSGPLPSGPPPSSPPPSTPPPSGPPPAPEPTRVVTAVRQVPPGAQAPPQPGPAQQALAWFRGLPEQTRALGIVAVVMVLLLVAAALARG